MSDGPRRRSVVSVALNRASGTTEILLSDGTVASVPFDETPFDSSSRLVRVEFIPRLLVLRATTDAGDHVEYDLPWLDSPADPLGGRPVVYLDQNKWSAVSDAQHGGGKAVQPADRDAALRLAELAELRRVVLPASGGHLFETSKRFDPERRYRLGRTLARLSRGWQMRDPVQVRRDELHDMFRQRDGGGTLLRMTPVFTLDPDVMFGAWRGRATVEPEARQPSLPPEAEAMSRALVAATVAIDMLLNAERIPPGDTTAWGTSNLRFSDWLDGSQRDAQQKRDCVDGFLLGDLQRDLAEEAFAAGSTAQQMSAWVLSEFGAGLGRLKSAAVYREAMHARHLNPGTRWRSNDLIDLLYLSCAAAYADVIVCERHMAGVLRQAQGRLRRGASVHRELHSAVQAIEALLPAR